MLILLFIKKIVKGNKMTRKRKNNFIPPTEPYENPTKLLLHLSERKEPKIKVGDIVKDFNGYDYKVHEISNEYNEVSKYDSLSFCFDYSTDEQLREFGLDPEGVLYCAVENSFNKTFVFLISRDSTILGE